MILISEYSVTICIFQPYSFPSLVALIATVLICIHLINSHKKQNRFVHSNEDYLKSTFMFMTFCKVLSFACPLVNAIYGAFIRLRYNLVGFWKNEEGIEWEEEEGSEQKRSFVTHLTHGIYSKREISYVPSKLRPRCFAHKWCFDRLRDWLLLHLDRAKKRRSKKKKS